MTRPVKEVLIVGRDAAAWLAALALHRAFAGAGVRVRVVELPSLLTAADAYAAAPALGGLHRLLGLEEAEVLDASSGVPVLGQRFANWSRAGAPFMHGYDTQRVGINDIDFVQFWVKARAEGLAVELEDFSLASVAAKQGRSVIDGDGTRIDLPVSPGYHLDARGYVDLLRSRALAAGIEARSAAVRSIERDGDVITGLVLDDGLRVEADLYVDASGGEALLAADASSSAFESWRSWFGADRMLTASAKALRPLPAYAQIAAFEAGWIGLHPLRDRTAVTVVYDSTVMADRAVLEAVPVLTGLALEGEASVEAFEAGARPAWIGNCVALGAAAAVLEPLDAVQLHLVQMGLSLLIGLFPVEADDMPEAEAFNAGFASHVRNVRDFQLAHYALNRRFDERFWDRARAADLPDALKARLRLFAARGIVPTFDDESFQEQNWIASFVGHGLIPGDHDPLVDAVPEAEQMDRFRSLLGRIAEEVRAMPAVDPAFGAAG